MTVAELRHEDDRRDRIVAAAARLLEAGGRGALSTRAVSAAAGVQGPTIYRLFGDKQGLLDAVAIDGFYRYLASKADLSPSGDPVDDLRAGWDLHVAMGLANPSLYSLLYDMHRGGGSPAAGAANDRLVATIRRVAEAGRLRVPERRAAQLVHAAGHGTTLVLITLPVEDRDPELSRTAREAVISAITTEPAAVAEPPADRLVTAAVSLRALLPDTAALSRPERELMRDWLDRLAVDTPGNGEQAPAVQEPPRPRNRRPLTAGVSR